MAEEGMTILVIDGNRVGRKFYGKLLRQHFQEARILEVELGEDGLFFCQSEPISCVLVDDNLPDMNCIAFMDKLRTLTARKNANMFIPVVVLTGEGDEARAVEAMKAGAQDYLVKGNFAPERLAKSMTNAMEKVELQRLLERKHHDLEHANQVLTREILERKRAEESLRLFRDLTNQTVDSLFIVKPEDGSLVDFNDSACTNLGYTRNEFNQLKIDQFDVGIEKSTPRAELVKNIVAKGELAYESEFRRKDGGSYPVEVMVKHIHRDKFYYLVGVARDITERKRVEAQLRDLSNRDGLTGVYNRRFLDETLDIEWKRLRREAQPLSLIMFDVDYFKFYNDHYGHQAGDGCLRSVAQRLGQNIRRPADVLARYGGEEFAVVLPNTDSAGAVAVGNHLLQQVEALALPHAKSPFHHVTLSVGVSTLVPNEAQTPRNLIELADGALYRSKEQGRNRVTPA